MRHRDKLLVRWRVGGCHVLRHIRECAAFAVARPVRSDATSRRTASVVRVAIPGDAAASTRSGVRRRAARVNANVVTGPHRICRAGRRVINDFGIGYARDTSLGVGCAIARFSAGPVFPLIGADQNGSLGTCGGCPAINDPYVMVKMEQCSLRRINRASALAPIQLHHRPRVTNPGTIPIVLEHGIGYFVLAATLTVIGRPHVAGVIVRYCAVNGQIGLSAWPRVASIIELRSWTAGAAIIRIDNNYIRDRVSHGGVFARKR